MHTELCVRGIVRTAYISIAFIEKLNRPCSPAGKGTVVESDGSLTFKHMWLTKSHENLNFKLCFLTAGCAQYLIYVSQLPLRLFKSGVYTSSSHPSHQPRCQPDAASNANIHVSNSD